ncbi:hypothetical protein QQS21_000783 [Conoideocrella luteorostrata]|uniref:Uncharacterized protein n=1 Tax=Conoideocrella luteorostrata TaxID=1105319 RepID=A0AAJ0D1G4_9HYPO|nr:hypothetical protein QQS21_000783 [Conoideocrella luteorostrata]
MLPTREVELAAMTTRHNEWNGNPANESKIERIPAQYMSSYSLKSLQTFIESTLIVSEWVDGDWQNQNLGVSAALLGDVNVSDRFDNLALSMTN